MIFQIDDNTRLVSDGNSWAQENRVERVVGKRDKTHAEGELYIKWVPKYWSSFGALLMGHHERQLVECENIQAVLVMYNALNAKIDDLAMLMRVIQQHQTMEEKYQQLAAKDGEEKMA